MLLSFSSCKTESADEKYIQLAKEINARTPYDFSNAMRLDSAKAVSKYKFKYYYTLLNDPNSSVGNFVEKVKPQIIYGLARFPQAKEFKEDNMTIIYAYSHNGSLFAEIEVKSSEY